MEQKIEQKIADISLTNEEKKVKTKNRKKKSKKPSVNAYENIQIVPNNNIEIKDAPAENAVSFINSNSHIYKFTIKSMNLKGRCALANTSINVSDTILQEIPFASSIIENYTNVICGACFDKLDNTLIFCENCFRIFYCSQSCKNNNKKHHILVCRAYKDLTLIKEKLKLHDENLIKFLIEVIASYHENKEGDKEMLISNTNSLFRSNTQDFLAMQSHVENGDSFKSDVYKPLYDIIITYLNTMKVNISFEQIVSFISIINSNCHELAFVREQAQYGIGLFPLSSLFNHSCYPNAVYTSSGNRIFYKAIRPIGINEEITVSYIPLHDSRFLRREVLFKSKNFFCNCRRCLLLPHNQDELLKFNNDQFLEGVICPNCKNTSNILGIVRPLPQNITEASTASYICNNCKLTVNQQDINKVESICTSDKDEVIALYSEFRQKGANLTAKQVTNKLITIINKLQQILHPKHCLLIDLNLALSNMYRFRTGDSDKSRTEIIKIILDQYDSIYPMYHPNKLSLLESLTREILERIYNIPSGYAKKLLINEGSKFAKQLVDLASVLLPSSNENISNYNRELLDIYDSLYNKFKRK